MVHGKVNFAIPIIKVIEGKELVKRDTKLTIAEVVDIGWKPTKRAAESDDSHDTRADVPENEPQNHWQMEYYDSDTPVSSSDSESESEAERWKGTVWDKFVSRTYTSNNGNALMQQSNRLITAWKGRKSGTKSRLSPPSWQASNTNTITSPHEPLRFTKAKGKAITYYGKLKQRKWGRFDSFSWTT